MDNITNLAIKIRLSKGVGNKTFNALLEKVGGIQNLISNNFEFEGDFKYKKIISEARKIDKNSIIDKIQKEKIKVIGIWENEYPKNLKEIFNPPSIIYVKGNYSNRIFDNCISVIGTRKITNYGKKWTKSIVEDLIDYKFTVVSGMAFGVDTLAHKTAIESKGKTVAVLAGSVDSAIPLSNNRIYKEIIENEGIILSEFPPFTKIVPGMFVSRNRIVAGLSSSLIVTEADEKSGALITANLAFESNREVFAVPGSLDMKMSSGCNKLISEGKANLLQSTNDIFNFYGLNNIQKKDDKTFLQNLSLEEKEIYNNLKLKSRGSEELSLETGIPINKTLQICTNLELQNIITRDGSGKYMLI